MWLWLHIPYVLESNITLNLGSRYRFQANLYSSSKQIADNLVWYLAKAKLETVLCLSDAERQIQVVSKSNFFSLMQFVKHSKLSTIC